MGTNAVYIHNKEESTEAPDWISALEIERNLLKALTDHNERLQDSVLSAVEEKLDYVGIKSRQKSTVGSINSPLEFCTAQDLSAQYLVEKWRSSTFLKSRPLPEQEVPMHSVTGRARARWKRTSMT